MKIYCVHIMSTMCSQCVHCVLTDNPVPSEAFLEDETAKKRLVKSYKLMLDFYGIQLSNDTTGEVQRANNWRNRFDNMDRLASSSFGHLTIILLSFQYYDFSFKRNLL